MKKLACITVIAVIALMSSGCSSIHQSASSSTTNPATGVVTTQNTTSDISALGTAKNIVEKLSASQTKTTQKLGAQGVDQMTSLAELLAIIKELKGGVIP